MGFRFGTLRPNAPILYTTFNNALKSSSAPNWSHALACSAGCSGRLRVEPAMTLENPLATSHLLLRLRHVRGLAIVRHEVGEISEVPAREVHIRT